MSGINTPRLLLGGLVAGAVIWLLEGVVSILYMDQMTADMAAHNLTMDLSAKTWIMSVVVSLLFGLVAIFLYAAARPRFGPGPKTAVIVAVALWLSGYVTSLVGYDMIGLFGRSLLVMWAVVGLLEIVLATVAGAAIYKE